MTRKDEIDEAIGGFGLWSVGEAMFKLGTEWADETMIEKACKWLQNNTMKELCMSEEDRGLVMEFIESFKEAMEE